MPQIRQYVANETVRADGQAASATAAAASATLEGSQAFASSVGGGLRRLGAAVQEEQTNDETSRLAAALTTFNAEATVEWNKRVQEADPNDTTLSQRFLDEYVNPRLSAIGDTIESDAARNLFERSSAGVRAGLFTQSATDQATLAGLAAVHNAQTVINQVSAAAMANPAGFEANMQLFRVSMTGLSGIDRMNPQQRMKMQEEGESAIAFATVRGMAQRNPAAARQEIASGRFNTWLDANQQAQLRNIADEVERDNTRQAAADEEMRIKAIKLENDQLLNAITATTLTPDGRVVLPPDYFANLRAVSQRPYMDPSAIRAMRSAGIAISKGDPPVSDPETYLNFLDLLGRGDVPLQEIYRARGEGRLNNKDYSFLLQWAKSLSASPERRDQQRTLTTFFNGMKGHITKSNLLVTDADGNQRYSEYVRDMSPRYWAGIAAGRKPEEMFAEFQREVNRYQMPMGTSTDRMSSGIETPNPPLPRVGAPAPPSPIGVAGAAPVIVTVAPRKPGESVSAYLARTKGRTPAAPAAASVVVLGAGGLDEEDEDLDEDLDVESEE